MSLDTIGDTTFSALAQYSTRLIEEWTGWSYHFSDIGRFKGVSGTPHQVVPGTHQPRITVMCHVLR